MNGFLNLVRILLHPYQVHLVHSALAHVGTSYNHYRNGHAESSQKFNLETTPGSNLFHLTGA